MKILSKKQEKKILQLASKNNGTISAADYKKIFLSTEGTVSKKRDFNFNVKIKHFPDEKKYEIIFNGKHLSTNVSNSMPFREKLRYKSSIKKAFINAALIYKKELPKKPFAYVELNPTVYLKRSRDDDGTSASLKILRDMIVNIGIVEDDKRKNLKMNVPDEIISKIWKIKIDVLYK